MKSESQLRRTGNSHRASSCTNRSRGGCHQAAKNTFDRKMKAGREYSYFPASYEIEQTVEVCMFSAQEVVRSLYLASLGREPDKEGAAHFSSALTRNRDSLAEIANTLFHCEERTEIKQSSSLQDHSQFGELGIVIGLLIKSGSKHQFIVDVGARGRERSNSYDLLHMGWSALLVEANPALYDNIIQEFSGTVFELAKCAVGSVEGILPFYIGVNDDVSSLLADSASGWGEIQGQIDVEVVRLHNLLEKNKVPLDFDILSLDIEGVDVAVLNDLIANSRYRPRIVIIEASYDFATKALSDVSASIEVQKIYRIAGQTRANLILQLV